MTKAKKIKTTALLAVILLPALLFFQNCGGDFAFKAQNPGSSALSLKSEATFSCDAQAPTCGANEELLAADDGMGCAYYSCVPKDDEAPSNNGVSMSQPETPNNNSGNSSQPPSAPNESVAVFHYALAWEKDSGGWRKISAGNLYGSGQGVTRNEAEAACGEFKNGHLQGSTEAVADAWICAFGSEVLSHKSGVVEAVHEKCSDAKRRMGTSLDGCFAYKIIQNGAEEALNLVESAQMQSLYGLK